MQADKDEKLAKKKAKADAIQARKDEEARKIREEKEKIEAEKAKKAAEDLAKAQAAKVGQEIITNITGFLGEDGEIFIISTLVSSLLIRIP